VSSAFRASVCSSGSSVRSRARPGGSPNRPPRSAARRDRLPETVSRHPRLPPSRSIALTSTTCRECGRSAAVFAGAVAFTCSACLLTGADSLPTCRRCLGAHWDARCDYNATEAEAAFSARVTAREGNRSAPKSTVREIGSVTDSQSVSAVAISSPSGGLANKTSRHGRPRIARSRSGSQLLPGRAPIAGASGPVLEVRVWRQDNRCASPRMAAARALLMDGGRGRRGAICPAEFMPTWHFCLCSRVCWCPPATAGSRQTGLPGSHDPLQMARLRRPASADGCRHRTLAEPLPF